MTSIGSITYKRITAPQTFPPAAFRLGRIPGLIINISALCFCAVIFVFSFFPPMPNPAPALMNWASAVYGGVVLSATIYFVVRARKVYVGPVALVDKNQ
jgi:choline transport protein